MRHSAKNPLPLPAQAELLKLFNYCPDTGILTWLAGQRKGRPAGTPTTHGYLVVRTGDVLYKVARIIWVLHHGVDPLNLRVDHLNGCVADNRIDNLRTATFQQNILNRRIRRDSASGEKNVYFDAARNKWRVMFYLDGTVHYIGRFVTREEAVIAAKVARSRLHGVFANHGVSPRQPERISA